MFEFGQALNAGQRPSTDITSEPTSMVSLEPSWVDMIFQHDSAWLGVCVVDLGDVIVILGPS
jgi:hypothetical protein